MTRQREPYLAYMLRLWRVEDQVQPTWRASLESPHTGERRAFSDLALLFAFLKDRTDDSPDVEITDGGTS